MASRTDRGVSARGNALTLTASLDGGPLLRALNGIAPDLFFTHAREVPPGFRPRRALGRWYRYYEPAADRDPALWQRAARELVGRIDVRSFGRGLPSEAPTWREVRRIDVRPSGGFLEVDIEAPSFVWGMVRKMVAALRAVDNGTVSVERLIAAARGDSRLPLPLAEPEGLVLWEVSYPEPWGSARFTLTRHQRAERERTVRYARVRERVRSEIWGEMSPADVP